MCFHFPLMREMQPSPRGRRNSQGAAFISRLCARCNRESAMPVTRNLLSFPAYARDATRQDERRKRDVALSFPAYARDATETYARNIKQFCFHFPLMREMQLRKTKIISCYKPFISRLCARCNYADCCGGFALSLSFPAYARDATSRH